MRKQLVVGAIVAVAAGAAMAQPVVPDGFTARRIAPLLDDAIPQLAAVDDADYGRGVITVADDNDVFTVRLIEPSGVVRVLATYIDGSSAIRAIRVRHDHDGFIDGLLHVTVEVEPEFTTVYLTVSPTGEVIERWRRGGAADQVGFDFELSDGSAGNPVGAILLDDRVRNGTQLGWMDSNYDFHQVDPNSLPPGRTDTDVQGMQRDATGFYGGGLLIADSENQDELTAIYELRDVDQGGTYRLVGQEVNWATRFYGDVAIVAPALPDATPMYIESRSPRLV